MLNIKEVAPFITSFHESVAITVDSPYIVSLTKAGKILVLIGTKHTKNPDDIQIKSFKKILPNIFTNKSSALYIEGKVPDLKELSEREQIQRFGEVSIFVNSAHKNKLVVQSIEPTFDEIIGWALELLPDEGLFAQWALLNILSVMISEVGRLNPSKKDALAKIISSIGDRYRIQGSPDKIYSSIVSSLRNNDIDILPATFDVLFDTNLKTADIIAAQKPEEGAYATNHAGMTMNKARDFGLMKNIIATINETSSEVTLAWQGLNHVLAQVPAYEALGFVRSE